MTDYQKQKNKIRHDAITLQASLGLVVLSYNELSIIQDKLYKWALRYGLIKEFKENGLI